MIIKNYLKELIGKRVPGSFSKIRKDDIFLVSYPKSGNTWLRFLFGNLIYEEGVNFTNINSKIPDIYTSSKQELDSIKSPRIIKSHEPFLKCFQKVIYIYRDPKDVVVSYYFWFKKFNPELDISFDNFFDKFIEGELTYGSWVDHFSKWEKVSKVTPEKIIFISYEEMKKDTFNNFKKITHFCGFKFSDDLIKRAVAKSSFEEMKKDELKNENDSFLNSTNTAIKFVRSGKSEWENYLSQNQIKIIENLSYKKNI